MAGSSAPVMNWAMLTTLCSALRSGALRSGALHLPYQVVMQPVKMLSIVPAVELFEDLMAHAKSFQPPEVEEVLSCPLYNCVGVCV